MNFSHCSWLGPIMNSKNLLGSVSMLLLDTLWPKYDI